jgi:20S proteasome subunit alpha 3
MARRYDQSTTTFSPEGNVPVSHRIRVAHGCLLFLGRLHQVEYAIEAINSAGTCLALQSTDGIVLAAERKVVSKLLAPSKASEKTTVIDDHLVCLVAGLTSDANILINEARMASQRYLYTYHQPMPVEHAVRHVCNYKQAYTQYGGLRPFGTSFLFCGWDSNFGYQLYQTDPSGNYSGWKATVIGEFPLFSCFCPFLIASLLLFSHSRTKQSSGQEYP